MKNPCQKGTTPTQAELNYYTQWRRDQLIADAEAYIDDPTGENRNSALWYESHAPGNPTDDLGTQFSHVLGLYDDAPRITRTADLYEHWQLSTGGDGDGLIFARINGELVDACYYWEDWGVRAFAKLYRDERQIIDKAITAGFFDNR